MTVQTAPSVTADPSDQTVLAGGTASFTAAASGNPTPSVQWEVDTGSGYADLSDEGVYSGSGSDTLTITGATATMNGYQYEAVFSNGVGAPATTTAATLTVQTAPSVTTNPSDQTVLAGGTASFTAAASGNPTPGVQWEVDTGSGYTSLSDEGVYSGSGTDTLTISGATAAMSGYQYEAVFSNGVGAGDHRGGHADRSDRPERDREPERSDGPGGRHGELHGGGQRQSYARRAVGGRHRQRLRRSERRGCL